MATMTKDAPATERSSAGPAYQAYRSLHLGFVVAPIVAGLWPPGARRKIS